MIAVGRGVLQAEFTASGGFCAWSDAVSLRRMERLSQAVVTCGVAHAEVRHSPGSHHDGPIP